MRQEITRKTVRALFDYDPLTGVVTRSPRSIHDKRSKHFVGDLSGAGYLTVWINSRRYQLHRIVWLWVNGRWPTREVDHINRNKTDNRIANLRDVSHRSNLQNMSMSARNTSGYTGVHWNKKSSSWQAQITSHGRKHHLGYFGCPVEASKVYGLAKLTLHDA